MAAALTIAVAEISSTCASRTAQRIGAFKRWWEICGIAPLRVFVEFFLGIRFSSQERKPAIRCANCAVGNWHAVPVSRPELTRSAECVEARF